MTSSAPALTPWGTTWRFVLAVLIAGLAWSELAIWQWREARSWFWFDLALGLTCLAIVWWRRQHPVVVTTVVTLATAVSASAGGAATLALFSLATRRRWREIVPLAILSFVAGVVLTAMDPTVDVEAVIIYPLIAVVVGFTIGWGMYVGSRRELLQSLRDRARTAETEQAARIAQARTAERTRIAREMHDVLAHRISLVTMHAGALSHRSDLQPVQVQETAGLIRSTAHQAMVELREVLGVLREDAGDAAPEPPQPDASDLPTLLDEARDGGMHLLVHTEGVDLEVVPPTVGRTAYRLVQEALTNARKHAPDTLVQVHLSGRPGESLEISVRNRLPLGPVPAAPASGLGLVGLQERAELAGGTLRHRLEHDSFVLEGALPWPA